MDVSAVIDSIIREVGSWIFVAKEFKGLSLSSFLKDWLTLISSHYHMAKKVALQWKPPIEGVPKLNFDGSSKGNLRPASFGCVNRNHNSKVMRVICCPLGVCDSTEAEAMGLLLGLCEQRIMEARGCVVEADSAVVIDWGSAKGNNSWQLAHVINKIRS